ncbi:MAG: phage tail protein [Schwartzia sp.]|nr:phage tail protein [Schwartzia sp. (in: firmicutes)]
MTTSGITNSPFIGVDNFHIAKLLTDPVNGKATYDEVISFPWLRSVSIVPQTDDATLYADNQAVDTANVTSRYSLTIDTATLPLEYKALLLGHTIENGVMTVTSEDNAPYFAIMFETTKRNGKKRYVKFLKVRFSEPSETAQTKEEGVTYNTPSMTATAIYRNDKKAIYQADEEADGYVSTTGANWYASVDMESGD